MNASRAALIATALVSTWSTASAGELTISPTEDLTNFRTVSVNFNDATSAVDSLAIGSDIGLVTATSTATSAYPFLNPSASAPGTFGSFGDLAFGLGLAADGGLVLTQTGLVSSSFTAVTGGDYALLKSVVTSGSASDLTTFLNGTVTGDTNNSGNLSTIFMTGRTNTDVLALAKYGAADTAATVIGTAAFSPVPEPASMAVLGLGLAALKRRRRCHA